MHRIPIIVVHLTMHQLLCPTLQSLTNCLHSPWVFIPFYISGLVYQKKIHCIWDQWECLVIITGLHFLFYKLCLSEARIGAAEVAHPQRPFFCLLQTVYHKLLTLGCVQMGYIVPLFACVGTITVQCYEVISFSTVFDEQHKVINVYTICSWATVVAHSPHRIYTRPLLTPFPMTNFVKGECALGVGHSGQSVWMAFWVTPGLPAYHCRHHHVTYFSQTLWCIRCIKIQTWVVIYCRI